MKKAVIGIVSKPSIESDMWHYMEIVDDIRYVIYKNNALPIGILPLEKKMNFKKDDDLDNYNLTQNEKDDLKAILQKVDGVILEGGLVSNQYEVEIAKICIDKDIPILGICSGFNNLIRALGGKVKIDKNIFHNQFGLEIAHKVSIEPNSILYKALGKKSCLVNSIHTYIAEEKDVKKYKIIARCPNDNTVEAIELEGKRFVLGIKWHPELMFDMNAIFEEFIKKCKEKTNI